jgi:hypothetical protein
MTTIDFITELFCRIDDRMKPLPKHPQAHLWPSELVTVGVLHALKGVATAPFIAGWCGTTGRCFPVWVEPNSDINHPKNGAKSD